MCGGRSGALSYPSDCRRCNQTERVSRDTVLNCLLACSYCRQNSRDPYRSAPRMIGPRTMCMHVFIRWVAWGHIWSPMGHGVIERRAANETSQSSFLQAYKTCPCPLEPKQRERLTISIFITSSTLHTIMIASSISGGKGLLILPGLVPWP